jgi:hypothetical protein
MRTLLASAPFVCAVLVALLAAPSTQAQSADAVVQLHPVSAGPSDSSVGVSDAIARVVSPLPDAKGQSGTEKSGETTTHSEGGSSVTMSDVVMVVNDDGSATLSATFQGQGEPIALKSVHMESAAGPLDVASTQMWLPILPGKTSRAGDASDAGGFVVPRGLAPGQTVHLQFQFDNDTCLAIDSQTVRRNSTHDEIFPTNGQQLGPGQRTAAEQECFSA